MHPVIEEITRWKEPPRYDVIRRVARQLVIDVQPVLDEADALRARVKELEAAQTSRKAASV